MASLYELDFLRPYWHESFCDYKLTQFAALLEKNLCAHLKSWNHIYQSYELALNQDDIYYCYDIKPKVVDKSDNHCFGGLDLIEDEQAWVFAQKADDDLVLCVAQYEPDNQRISYCPLEQYISMSGQDGFFAPVLHDTNLYLFSHQALGDNMPAMRLHRLNALTLKYFSGFESKKIQKIMLEKNQVEAI